MKLYSLLFFCFLSAGLIAKEVNYKLKIENPHRNYFNIEIICDVEYEEYIDFVMPAWTPGSYVIQNWSRNVFDVHGKNEENNELVLYKTGKQTWRVETDGSKKITFSYNLYAFSLNNPYHAHIERDFAYYNGAVIFMYVQGNKNVPHNIEFIYPGNWEVHSSLQIKLDDNKYQAANYDEFIDCPAFLGKLYKFSFDVQGKEHFVVLNSWYDTNEDQIIEDLSKMVNWYYEMFGELPYDHYTFFLRVSEPGGGGIEHLYSNVSSVTPKSLKGDIEDEAYYSKLLMLESHEYFHLYNVKRIRPTGLGPFDYEKEVFTKMLWFSEGFTSYYTHRPLSKADILDESIILMGWSTLVNRFINNTALNIKPVSQYSYDAWLKSNIPDYSFRTYYTKGALIGLLLDIEMRIQTNHEKTMDGFFKYLYMNVYKKDKTFDINTFLEHVNKYSNLNFSDLFYKYANGVEDLPLHEFLNKIGLELKIDSEIPFTGIKLNSKINDAAIVYYVYPNSPADALKIGRGDHIISINDEKVTKENWIEVINKIETDENVELKWVHGNQILISDLAITKNYVTSYSIQRKPDITEFQKKFLAELILP